MVDELGDCASIFGEQGKEGCFRCLLLFMLTWSLQNDIWNY